MAKKSDRNNDVAAKKVTQIKKALDGVITNMVKDPSKFVVAPDKDFTRNRTLTFKKMLHIILGMGGASLQKELHDYFEDNTGFATKSAFVQQRGKIRPEAFKHLLHQFNKSCNDTKTYMGSHLYACDGTVVTVAANPADEETHIKGSKNAVGDNQYHISALYDLLNKTYTDAIIKGVNFINEPQVAVEMIKNLDLRGKGILICDRGYAALNLMERCNRKVLLRP